MLAMIPVLGGGVASSSLLSTTKIEGLKPSQHDSLEEGEGCLVGCSSRFKAVVACGATRLDLSREPSLEWLENEAAEWSILAAVGRVASAPGGLEKEKELSAGDDGDMPMSLSLLLAEEYDVSAGLRVGMGGGNNGDSCSCSNRNGNDGFDGLTAAGGGFFWGVSWVKSTHIHES